MMGLEYFKIGLEESAKTAEELLYHMHAQQGSPTAQA
jgi:hypothetical protein